MLNKITKLAKKEDEEDSNSDDSDEEDEEDEENCAVCLNEITGDDVGVLKCGHIFCYGCIKQTLETKPKCPLCTKPSSPKDLFMISYEQKKKVLTPEAKDKNFLIDKIGTKLANLILYIKSINEKCIIFSQWDDLLIKVGQVLDLYSINNVFCRGNIWVRDKAIRDFTSKEDIKVCMLSSESAASGTNLTAASTVILLDPVYGTYEYRRNTEWQAIGRAYRMGQTKKVTVVRFIIKDTVEEEILKLNLIEDKKFKDDTAVIKNLIELTDENISTNNIDMEKLISVADSKATSNG
jgi:SNF2 family DNA or RNA helicase